MTLEAVRALPLGSTTRTMGIVIAEDGRLGSPTLLGIGDATGGLVVHLPSSAGTYRTRHDASTSPASLRLRTGNSRSDRPRPTSVSSGPAACRHRPPSRPPVSARRSRAALVTATGRLTAKPKKSASGDLTLVLERDGAAPVKVMADVIEPSRQRGLPGRRHVPGHGVRRSAGHALGRPRRLPRLGSRPCRRDPGHRRDGVSRRDVRLRVAGAWRDDDRVRLDRPSAQGHRPPGRHRRDRHGARDAPRRERSADRRPGRLGCRRAAAADRNALRRRSAPASMRRVGSVWRTGRRAFESTGSRSRRAEPSRRR